MLTNRGGTDGRRGMTGSGRWSEQIAPVVRYLAEQADELAARQMAAVRATIPSYQTGRAVPDATIMAMGRRNVERVIKTLRRAEVPRPEEMVEAQVARERTEQGIPADDMINGYRLVHRLLGDVVMEQASALALDHDVLAQASRLLWELADVGTAQIMAVRRQAEMELTRYDEFQRADFLRRLLFGGVPEPELAGRGGAYGLLPERPYFAVRARPNGEASVEAVLRAVESSGRDAALPVLAGVIEGDVVAVAPERPSVPHPAVTVGVGGPVPLARIEQAFRTASRTLNLARRLGLPGTVGLEDLSLRVAVASEPELGAMLVERYLRPLDAEGEFGVLVEETVRQYLESGQRVFETAKRLGVHSNTLRYRLDRFEKLTGTFLSAPLASLEVWWALEFRRIERHDREPRAAEE